MFMLNKFAAISRIFAACPYLDEIVMRRRLPDEIEITVTECVPAAAIETAEGCYIIDADCKLLELTDKAGAAGYCLVTGVELDEPEVGKTANFTQPEKQKTAANHIEYRANNDILDEIKEINLDQILKSSFRMPAGLQCSWARWKSLRKRCVFLASALRIWVPKNAGSSMCPTRRRRGSDPISSEK